MLIAILLTLFLVTFFKRSTNQFKFRNVSITNSESLPVFRVRKKPDWVVQEVLKIKAQSPNLSCRLIAYLFNRRFAHKGQSVGKTFVSYTIQAHLYEIQVMRKHWKNQKPHKVKFNQYWGMDISFVDNKLILGVIEHHSRKLIGLIPLSNKSSLNIIKQLIFMFRDYSKPKIIRTDNEACFNSKTLKLFFKLLGIKHQAIEKHSPWQNGRIERLFGTLKSTISGMAFSAEELPLICYDFQQWYNVIRPHQNLKGKTPEEVYWNQARKQYRH
ncbi:MAG: transposase [Kangiellaceae bacterium]|nr:transposase [Kangiellaceae bacterium]